MFKIKRDDAFWWTVAFLWIDEDQEAEKSFDVKFDRLTMDEIAARQQGIGTRVTDEPPETDAAKGVLFKVREFVDIVMLDFRNIESDDFDKDGMRQYLLNNLTLCTTIYHEYNKAMEHGALHRGN